MGRWAWMISGLALLGGPLVAGEMALPVSRLDLSEWVGVWRSEDFRYLTISMPDHDALLVDGLAADDGESWFFARILPGWISVDNTVEIAIGPDGALPSEKARQGDCLIHMRLDWNINWIDLRDNKHCVADFTGRYEWHEPRGSGD